MSGTKALENATSLERFLNRHVLFVQGIDQNTPKSEVLQVLNQVLRQPQQGRIDILTTQDGKMRGTAFLNFHTEEDARAALGKYRFGLEIRGRPIRMQFSSDREFKDTLQGPLVAKFKVLIRNLPEELAPEALFERFSEYGEIIHLHNSCDHYGQHFAIIQYVEASSAQAAVRNANRERILNHVLLVEPYKPNASYGVLPRNINQSSAQQQPVLPAGAVTNGGPAAATSRTAGGLGGTLPGTTYAALQQQQELELAEQERNANSEHQSDSARSAAAPAGPFTSNDSGAAAFANIPAPPVAASMAVSSFFAATTGPLQPLTAPGSLAHLLSTALHHVQALEEHLCCPITQEPLVDPVVASDGNTYERLAITAWLEQHDTSPLTNEVLAHKGLTPNNLLRKIAEDLQGLGHTAVGDGGTPASASAVGAAAPVRGAASGDLGNVAMAPPLAVAAPAMSTPTPQHPEAPVPIPVPVPVGGPSMTPSSYHTTQHAVAQPIANSAHTHHVQAAASHTQQHLRQQQQHQTQTQQSTQQQTQTQYSDYGQLPAVMRPTLMPTPVTFVHVPQPQAQPFQVQTAAYYAYRPMGM